MNAHPKSRRSKRTVGIQANLDVDVQAALQNLSERLKVPKSELVNIAVADLIVKLKDAQFGHRFDS